MSDAYFLVYDQDGRVGLFTWDPEGPPPTLPKGVVFRDYKRLGSVSERSLQRLAACTHAAEQAILNRDVQPPQEIPPDVLVAVDPPQALLMRDDVVKLRLSTPAVLLGFGTADDAWTLARKAGGWIDVYNAWEDPDSPSGLAVYSWVRPGEALPDHMPRGATFRRVRDPVDPAFTMRFVPEEVGGHCLAPLKVRFLEHEFLNPSAFLGAIDPPPPPNTSSPSHTARLAFVIIGTLLLVLVTWLIGR